jgi:16S rRNA (adenine1518-N6/adenine1519-N6)-dimethyltransferase
MTTAPPLRKALGQHHLRQGERCAPAIDWLRPAGSLVVEIGPGGGVLTRELLGAGARVLAWELDPAWAFELRRRLPERTLGVVVGDALELPWEWVPPGALAAGNLPYAVATPILERFLLRGAGLPRAVFLVQEEVAERLVARPGTRAYGLSTVTTAALARVEVLARLPPGSFRPPPKVSGAFVGVERRQRPHLALGEMGAFRATVAQAFAQRRKTIANSLAATHGRAVALAALELAAVDPRRRAETLEIEEFVTLHRALEKSAQKNL